MTRAAKCRSSVRTRAGDSTQPRHAADEDGPKSPAAAQGAVGSGTLGRVADDAAMLKSEVGPDQNAKPVELHPLARVHAPDLADAVGSRRPVFAAEVPRE